MPTVGQIVHYRETRDDPCQAALVVHVWDFDANGPLNLLLFRDGANDRQQTYLSGELVAWKTSISHAAETPPERPSWHTAESLH